jgi:LPXTG-motif cell wall-anchored protein
MPTLTRALVAGAIATAALLTAPVAHATPSGDNGTVKIHDAATDEELRRNEPHVCAFYLDAFGFDGDQQVDWHIESWVPAADVKGETVKSGELALDTKGHGRTDDLSLPNGRYKLFWNFDGEKGSAKHKVFWTDCAESGEEGGNGSTPSGAPSASVSPSGTTEVAEAVEAVAQPSSSSSSGAPSTQGSGSSSDLAETGSGAPVGLISAAAAALLGAGGYLVFRRRKTQQG